MFSASGCTLHCMNFHAQLLIGPLHGRESAASSRPSPGRKQKRDDERTSLRCQREAAEVFFNTQNKVASLCLRHSLAHVSPLFFHMKRSGSPHLSLQFSVYSLTARLFDHMQRQRLEQRGSHLTLIFQLCLTPSLLFHMKRPILSLPFHCLCAFLSILLQCAWPPDNPAFFPIRLNPASAASTHPSFSYTNKAP